MADPDGPALAPVEDSSGTPLVVDQALSQEHAAPATAPPDGDSTAAGP